MITRSAPASRCFEAPNLPAVDEDAVVRGLHFLGAAPVDRIVLEKVGEGAGVGEVVDSDDLDVLPTCRPAEQAPDAPETVDPDLNRHVRSSF
jgi:hypothetical protein